MRQSKYKNILSAIMIFGRNNCKKWCGFDEILLKHNVLHKKIITSVNFAIGPIIYIPFCTQKDNNS